jgi:hypothetical protein
MAPCSSLETRYSDEETLRCSIRIQNDNAAIIMITATGPITAPAIQALLVEDDELVDCVGLLDGKMVAPEVLVGVCVAEVKSITDEDAMSQSATIGHLDRINASSQTHLRVSRIYTEGCIAGH